jgi:FkbM family methyltransferase
MASELKQGVGRWLEKRGYVTIPTWRLPTYDLEQHLRALFDKFQIDTVLDVGANAGQYVKFLREYVGYQGHVVSFEPVPEMFAELEGKAASDPRWTVKRCALGSADGTLPLTITTNSDLSSFLTPDATSLGTDTARRALTGQRQELVEVRRLDSVMPELEKARPMRNIYLKIDTQGFDLHVIEGAGALLERIIGMQSETSMIKQYKESPDLVTSLQSFRAHGFDITGMFPIWRDSFLRVVEFDTVMIRHSLASEGKRVMTAGAGRPA